jgi:uncharacterized protein (TIGR02217 family)
MAFLESQFPPKVSYGATGGPVWQTDVVVINSGYEQRNSIWAMPLRAWDVAHGIKTQTDLDALIAFFLVAKGRANGFRFKDWLDYQADTTTGILGTGVGSGAATYQLKKRYTAASTTHDRSITKPVSGTITAYRGGSPMTAGVGAGQYSLDTTTGVLTMVADSSKTISGITKANPGVVTTSTSHGFTTGQSIYLSGIVGMTQLNGSTVTITNVDATHFSIGVNTTSYSTYSSGGTAAKYPQPSETMTWAGEFDCPARFDTDSMKSTVDSYNNFSWGQIPVVEIR